MADTITSEVNRALRVSVTYLPHAFFPRTGGPDPRTPEQRDARRKEIVAEMAAKQDEARSKGFSEILPRVDEFHFLHPNPEFYRQIARALRDLRFSGWGQAVLRASIAAMDVTDDGLWNWLDARGHILPRELPRESRSESGLAKLTVVSGLKLVDPGPEARKEFHPDTTLWDVEDAAMHELEESMGGLATMYLHAQLPDPGQKRLKARSRVETYLMVNRQTLPEDPWDPNHWGHDARLKSLTIADLQDRTEYDLTPAFDPDVLAYTVNQPLTGISISAVAADTLAEVRSDNTTAGKLTVTVTAKDGETKRVYTVTTE